MILFQRGWTGWGFQIGKYFMYWPYIKYWKTGARPTVGVDYQQ